MSDDLFSRDVYNDLGNRADAWKTSAETLWQAAQAVDAINRPDPLPDGT